MRQLMLTISLLAYVCSCDFFLPSGVHSQHVNLIGIQCDLVPLQRATTFQFPSRITQDFGKVRESKTLGVAQHTGIDYGLGSAKPVFPVAPGVVVFSTKTDRTEPDLPRRGGLVIVRHLPPDGEQYQFDPYQETFTHGKRLSFTITAPEFSTPELFSYYLHLDPDQIFVSPGQQVDINQSIAKLYKSSDFKKDGSGKFDYPSHLHIEIWKTCSTTERNGYDAAGTEFQEAVTELLVDPNHFPEIVPAAIHWLSFVEGDPRLPGDGIIISRGAGFVPEFFELDPIFSLSSVTDGITVTAFHPSLATRPDVVFQTHFPFWGIYSRRVASALVSKVSA